MNVYVEGKSGPEKIQGR